MLCVREGGRTAATTRAMSPLYLGKGKGEIPKVGEVWKKWVRSHGGIVRKGEGEGEEAIK